MLLKYSKNKVAEAGEANCPEMDDSKGGLPHSITKKVFVITQNTLHTACVGQLSITNT
jgi:hypothetical protein